MRLVVSDEISDLQAANRLNERLLDLYTSERGVSVRDRDDIIAGLRETHQERDERIAWFEAHYPSPLHQGEPSTIDQAACP